MFLPASIFYYVNGLLKWNSSFSRRSSAGFGSEVSFFNLKTGLIGEVAAEGRSVDEIF